MEPRFGLPRKGALAVHLLACNKVLERRVTEEEEFSINAVAGTRIELSRENLREWDATARAVCSHFLLKGRFLHILP